MISRFLIDALCTQMYIKCINFVLTISILLSNSATFFAQKLKFEQLGIRNDLPSNEVYSLFEDKYGYVWSFTEYGIVKHNGSEFVPVCKNIPIIELAVYAVCETHKGELFSKPTFLRFGLDSECDGMNS